MDWVFIGILTTLCFAMLAPGLIVKGKFYQYPFLAAGIFLSFILPQLPGLANSRFISDAALTKTLIFSCLCLGICQIGWRFGFASKAITDYAFSEQRLLKAAGFLSLVGGYFFYKFGHLPDDQRLVGQLTGLPVAYLFFSRLLTYGFALAVICYARKTSYLALSIILFDTIFYLERIVIAGRRSDTAEFCLIIALAFWFQKRWAVPRIAMVGGIALSMVGMLSAAEYRQATYYGAIPDWNAVGNIDLAKNWDRLIEQGGPEMTNAVMAIENVDQSRNFNFGKDTWNDLVFTFVPAQLVGRSIKESLTIDLTETHGRSYTPGIGETSTGMTDAFASFWYFGFLKFFLLAFLLGKLYVSAMKGNTVAQVIYMLSAVTSMLVITHFTNELLIAWVHMVIFLTPALYYANIPKHRLSGMSNHGIL